MNFILLAWMLFVTPHHHGAIKQFYLPQTFETEADCVGYAGAHMHDLLTSHGVSEADASAKMADLLKSRPGADGKIPTDADVADYLAVMRAKLGLPADADVLIDHSRFVCSEMK